MYTCGFKRQENEMHVIWLEARIWGFVKNNYTKPSVPVA